MGPPLIEFRNVSKEFNEKRILKDINLRILQGDLFGIIGTSGAGKTSLLRCLIGFYKINAGQILFEGKNISGNLRQIREIFGFASQDNCFYENLTVEENLHYFGRMYGLKKELIKERSEELVTLVELQKSKKALSKNLSGGMQRRLDLACSLMHSPKILILDEPTAGLDPILRKHMWKLIKKIHESGTTIIVSTHLLSEIEHVCTNISIISEGEVLVVDSPDKLKDLYSKNEEIHLESFPGNYKKIREKLKKQKAGIASIAEREHKLIIYTSRAEPVLGELLKIIDESKEKLLELSVSKPSLDEVFEVLTGAKEKKTSEADYASLKNYVADAKKEGIAEDKIKETLMLQGHQESEVEKVLKETK